MIKTCNNDMNLRNIFTNKNLIPDIKPATHVTDCGSEVV